MNQEFVVMLPDAMAYVIKVTQKQCLKCNESIYHKAHVDASKKGLDSPYKNLEILLFGNSFIF